ncbi:MAG: NAD(P)-dependent oxidoreductase [Deltaproteobacteria bacterium]|nr:NAD(P)-dependent oxidoreductase [Deltaproteobacteria bacterium]
MSTHKTTIGFIGTGVMGRSMAGHLIGAGYSLRVFNRSVGKLGSLVEKGAVACRDSAEVARGSDVVITMVGYPQDVEQTLLGPHGVIENLRAGGTVIDMTTSSPVLARSIAAVALQHNVGALDAPVSGGDTGARNAQLSIMVGGDAAVFDHVLPILECMGKTIVHQGPPGSGQLTKLVNQIAIAANIVGVCEAMAFAKGVGLDPLRVLSSIEKGAAGSVLLSTMAPRMLAGDFAAGFYVKHIVKDLGLALAVAKEQNLSLPGLKQAAQLFENLCENGGAEYGTQALFRLYVES